MCDFKPGDEVVCVDDRAFFDPRRLPIVAPPKGSVWTVFRVGLRPDTGEVSVWIVGFANPSRKTGEDLGFFPRRFRKVARRNDSLSIEAFLTIKPGFEEPKRAPAKKRERV
jgi:hypothetical protein